jgi:protein-S-isoprenylcysteine O-methyltransferase Ste14
MISDNKALHITFSVLYLLFLFERGYFQSRAMRISGEARRIRENPRKTITVLLLFLVAQVWVIGSFVYVVKPASMAWTAFPIPTWARWLGVAITGAGMSLEFSTQIHLGRNYSTTLHIGEKQSLVTTGPYQYIRHPMYTALITVGIGMGLMSTSWYFLLPFIATGIVVAFRVRREEEAMVEKFGEEYTQYAQGTGMFLPPVGKKKRQR